jgi:hypothetical protein
MNQSITQNDNKITITYGNQSIETSTNQLQEIANDIGRGNVFDDIHEEPDYVPRRVNEKKQIVTINPKIFCNAWFAVKEFIYRAKESDVCISKTQALFENLYISFDKNTLEIATSDGRCISICTIDVDTNIKGTFGICLNGNVYNEFNAFMVGLNSIVKNKSGSEIDQLLSIEIKNHIVTFGIYEISLFGDEPILQMNLKIQNDDILQYKRFIRDAVEQDVSNIFSIDLQYLTKIQRSITRLTGSSIVKVMQDDKSYVVTPFKQSDECSLYFVVMRFLNDTHISDFEFKSIQV